jgi:hypothetical protein
MTRLVVKEGWTRVTMRLDDVLKMCHLCYARFNDEGLCDHLLTRQRSFTFLASSEVCISTLLLELGMTRCMSIGNC